MESNRVRVWKRLGIVLAVISVIAGSAEMWRQWTEIQRYASFVADLEARTLNEALACAVRAPDADYQACSLNAETRRKSEANLAVLKDTYPQGFIVVAVLPLVVLCVFWTAAWITTGQWRANVSLRP